MVAMNSSLSSAPALFVSGDWDRGSLVVHDGVNVGDDTVIRGGIDSLLEILLGTPFGTPGSLLFELSQIPNIVATISVFQAKGLTYRIQFPHSFVSMVSQLCENNARA